MLTPITYAQTSEELKSLYDLGFKEFIVSVNSYSRTIETDENELLKIISSKKSFPDIKLFFEFDILLDEKDFKDLMNKFSRLPLIDFDAIRVYDTGVMEFIHQNYNWLKIHMIVETGNHNLVALLTYENYLKEQLTRFVVSIELSKEVLESFTKQLKTPCELLGLGPILLFYTPRKLLGPILKNHSNQSRWIKATSEESPHSGFPVLENKHGTFMFNVKDLNILDDLDSIIKCGIKYLRFDIRFENMQAQNSKVADILIHHKKEIKIIGPRPFIKGFFNINKTDVLFKKLKNHRIIRNDENYLGEILDVEKEKCLTCIIKKGPVEVDKIKALKFITPEGKEKLIDHFQFIDLLKVKPTTLALDDLYMLNYVRGVTVKTQIYILWNK